MQQKIDPKRIRTDLDTQARVQTDATVVEEYATAMLRGDDFPPVEVFHDLDSDVLILVDGFHRLAAHLKARPDEEINVIIKEGTLSDARWASFTVNATHGLRRSASDKRRIIAEALRHEKGVNMSDRQIAEHVGVDHKTVAAVRRELQTGGEIPHVDCREGKDGKAYAVKPAKADPEPETEIEGALISLPKFRDGKPTNESTFGVMTCQRQRSNRFCIGSRAATGYFWGICALFPLKRSKETGRRITNWTIPSPSFRE